MEKTIPLKILTPDKLFFSGDVTMLIVPEPKGTEGFLPHHAPVLKMLAKGQAKVYTGKNEFRTVELDGGHITVAQEIQIFTPRARWADSDPEQNA